MGSARLRGTCPLRLGLSEPRPGRRARTFVLEAKKTGVILAARPFLGLRFQVIFFRCTNYLGPTRFPSVSVRLSLTHRATGPADCLIRGSLNLRLQKCGKPNCHCAQGAPHQVLYLVQSQEGKKRQIFVPRPGSRACARPCRLPGDAAPDRGVSQLEWGRLERRKPSSSGEDHRHAQAHASLLGADLSAGARLWNPLKDARKQRVFPPEWRPGRLAGDDGAIGQPKRARADRRRPALEALARTSAVSADTISEIYYLQDNQPLRSAIHAVYETLKRNKALRDPCDLKTEQS